MVRLPDISDLKKKPLPKMSHIYELQLRKKLLEQQMIVLDSKCKKVGKILDKKKMKKNDPIINQNNSSSTNNSNNKNQKERQKKEKYNRVLEMNNKRKNKINNPKLKPEEMDRKVWGPMPETINMDGTMAQRRRKVLLERTQRTIDRQNKKPPVIEKFVYEKPHIPESMFPNRYLRGELPCTVIHKARGLALSWICPLEALDYEYYLPLFVDGIRVEKNPCRFMAQQGVDDLLDAARGHPEWIVPCISEVVKGLRFALSTEEDDTVRASIKVIRRMLQTNPDLGKALVPYYKVFLSVLNKNLAKRSNLGDGMDFKQDDIGEVVQETLELLEIHGGKNALVNIKFMVPTYTSCL